MVLIELTIEPTCSINLDTVEEQLFIDLIAVALAELKLLALMESSLTVNCFPSISGSKSGTSPGTA